MGQYFRPDVTCAEVGGLFLSDLHFRRAGAVAADGEDNGISTAEGS